MFERIKTIFKNKADTGEVVEVKPIDYPKLINEAYAKATSLEALDPFTRDNLIVFYYYMHCRVHGFHLSLDMAHTFLRTQQHIINQVDEYARRLS